jgi:hypothetical protein
VIDYRRGVFRHLLVPFLRPYLHLRFPAFRPFFRRGAFLHLVLPLRCPCLHFLALPAATLRHFFAAMLKALRACFAVLIFEPLSFEIRHFLNPGFTRVPRDLRFLTIVLCPGEERGTHRPFILWHIHVTFHRTVYLIGKYIKVIKRLFEKLSFLPLMRHQASLYCTTHSPAPGLSVIKS